MTDLSLWFVRPHYDEFVALYNNDIAHFVRFRTIYKLHTLDPNDFLCRINNY